VHRGFQPSELIARCRLPPGRHRWACCRGRARSRCRQLAAASPGSPTPPLLMEPDLGTGSRQRSVLLSNCRSKRRCCRCDRTARSRRDLAPLCLRPERDRLRAEPCCRWRRRTAERQSRRPSRGIRGSSTAILPRWRQLIWLQSVADRTRQCRRWPRHYRHLDFSLSFFWAAAVERRLRIVLNRQLDLLGSLRPGNLAGQPQRHIDSSRNAGRGYDVPRAHEALTYRTRPELPKTLHRCPVRCRFNSIEDSGRAQQKRAGADGRGGCVLS